MTEDRAIPNDVRPTAQKPVSAPPAGPAAAPSGLDLAVVEEASRTYRPVKRAAFIAIVSAIVTLIIGILAFPFVLIWPSLSSAFIILGILFVGIMEFKGHKKLKEADPGASRRLALNQLTFLGLITVYCVWQMLTFSTAELKEAALSPEFRAQAKDLPGITEEIDQYIDQYGMLVVCGFYGLVIVASIGFQGGLALYYYTRRKAVDAFLRQTPLWARRLVIESAR